jgi:hypothetical protein
MIPPDPTPEAPLSRPDPNRADPNRDHGASIAQAKQGSIAAIIQLLNESLAHLQVRTRAVLEKRVLQLLCEAETTEALDAATVVPHIRQILEAIAPPQFSPGQNL